MFNVLQVTQSVTVESDRAVVVFASDEAVQGSGFELSWDQGSYCMPQTTLTNPQGTFTDGTPPGLRYRWGLPRGFHGGCSSSPKALTVQRFAQL